MFESRMELGQDTCEVLVTSYEDRSYHLYFTRNHAAAKFTIHAVLSQEQFNRLYASATNAKFVVEELLPARDGKGIQPSEGKQ